MTDSRSFSGSSCPFHPRLKALALEVVVGRSPFGYTLILLLVEGILKWQAVCPDRILIQSALIQHYAFVRFRLIWRLTVGHVLGEVLAVVGGILILGTRTNSVTIPLCKGRRHNNYLSLSFI